MPVDTTRRRFLAVAAGASVAGAGSLAVAAAMPAAVVGIPAAVDPIYAAIERHRSAARDHDNAVHAEFGFEERCDGRFEMSEQQLETYWGLQDVTGEAFDRLQDASVDLMMTKPTTIAGVAALCQHLVPFLSEDDTPALPLEVKLGSDAKAFAAFCQTIAKATAALDKAVQS